MEVRTRPGGWDEKEHSYDHERAPFDVTISGPGSLFWLKPGTLEHQGTEITLYLKRGFKLRHDDRTILFERLRQHFGYPRSTEANLEKLGGDGVRLRNENRIKDQAHRSCFLRRGSCRLAALSGGRQATG